MEAEPLSKPSVTLSRLQGRPAFPPEAGGGGRSPLLRAGDCLYLYGITGSAPRDLSGIRGVEGDELFPIGYGDLACVVGTVPCSQYNQEEVSARSQEMDWIAPRAVQHHEVVRYLRQAGAVVPLKFGSLCSSAGKVREILQEHYPNFLHLLNSFEGREEWGVKVYVEQTLAIRAIEEAENVCGELPSTSEGEAYFLRKKRRQQLHEQLGAHLSALGQEIYERLLVAAGDGCKRRPSEASKPSQLSILNAAFLVDQQQFAGLRKRIEAVETDCQSYGMTVELDGPWVPYSFCEDPVATAAG